jgi:glycerol uptake facilitator-like aquaporin
MSYKAYDDATEKQLFYFSTNEATKSVVYNTFIETSGLLVLALAVLIETNTGDE